MNNQNQPTNCLGNISRSGASPASNKNTLRLGESGSQGRRGLRQKAKNNMNSKNKIDHRPTRPGFTLVEILTVIVIIGILAAISVPAIGVAMRRAKTTAIRVEIDVMSQAIAAYHLEHGDYPPDFYDWNQVERHFRKAFPDIDDNELRILSQFTHYNSSFQRVGEASGTPPEDPRLSGNGFDHYPHAIDRAEALVFCLGGFSADKKRPFTGSGGPLVKRTDAAFSAEPNNMDADDYLAYQYNTEREVGQFEFKAEQLSTVVVESTATINAFAYSRDEAPTLNAAAGITVSQVNNGLGLVYYPDPFPTCLVGSSELPIVYFSKQNYDAAWGYDSSALAWDGGGNEDHSQNVYLPNGNAIETGVARPYVTDIADTTPPTTIRGISVTAPKVLQFAEANKFQLISAGLDSNYGGLISTGWGTGAAPVGIFPSGGYYSPFLATAPVTTKYQDDLQNASKLYGAQPQLDNVTNFSTSTLEADLP